MLHKLCRNRLFCEILEIVKENQNFERNSKFLKKIEIMKDNRNFH